MWPVFYVLGFFCCMADLIRCYSRIFLSTAAGFIIRTSVTHQRSPTAINDSMKLIKIQDNTRCMRWTLPLSLHWHTGNACLFESNVDLLVRHVDSSQKHSVWLWLTWKIILIRITFQTVHIESQKNCIVKRIEEITEDAINIFECSFRQRLNCLISNLFSSFGV